MKAQPEKILFIVSLSLILFGAGISVGVYECAPYTWFLEGKRGLEHVLLRIRMKFSLEEMAPEQMPIWYKPARDPSRPAITNTGAAVPGSNLVTRIGPNLAIVAEVIALDGSVIHRWDLDWFKIWPDADHMHWRNRPRNRPGTHVHGAVLLDDGDLVYNYENLGMVRIGADGVVKWRLEEQTHHSIVLDSYGVLWTCGRTRREEPNPTFPSMRLPYVEESIMRISLEGEVLQVWEVSELLHTNGYGSLMRLYREKAGEDQAGDPLHLNDVEPFPVGMKEGFFKNGDVLVSLRNVDTIFVFESDTGRIKHIRTGGFHMQHDPDFIDGNAYSVFDNLVDSKKGLHSRIVRLRAPEFAVEQVFPLEQDETFYTKIMGKHQWTSGGTLLITESMGGRGFEVTQGGDIVWEYVNYVETNVVGVVEEVTRLGAGPRTLAPSPGGG